jgi:hypothetical protein
LPLRKGGCSDKQKQRWQRACTKVIADANA